MRAIAASTNRLWQMLMTQQKGEDNSPQQPPYNPAMFFVSGNHKHAVSSDDN